MPWATLRRHPSVPRLESIQLTHVFCLGLETGLVQQNPVQRLIGGHVRPRSTYRVLHVPSTLPVSSTRLAQHAEKV